MVEWVARCSSELPGPYTAFSTWVMGRQSSSVCFSLNSLILDFFTAIHE